MGWFKRLFSCPGEFPAQKKIPPAPPKPEVDYPHHIRYSRSTEDLCIKTKKRKSGEWKYRISINRWALCSGLDITAKRRFGCNAKWIVTEVVYNCLIQSQREEFIILASEVIGRDLDDVINDFGGIDRWSYIS